MDPKGKFGREIETFSVQTANPEKQAGKRNLLVEGGFGNRLSLANGG